MIKDPYEIWISFAKSEVSGRVGIRRKFIKEVRLDKNNVLGLYAETRNGHWVAGSFFRGGSTGAEDRELIVKAIGDAILDARVKLEKIEKTIMEHEEKLEAARAEAKKLLDLAMDRAVSQGATFKAKMAELEGEILKIEDVLGKLQAQKNATQMSAHSGEFLHSNIRFAMRYLDEAPPDAQKSLIRALIKEIMVYEDRIELRMYVNRPVEDTMSSAVPVTGEKPNKKRPTANGGALTARTCFA